MTSKKKRKTRAEKELMDGYNFKYGVTDGRLRSMFTSALREIFRNTRRKMFIEKVRIPYKGPKPYTFTVECAYCEKKMGHTERCRPLVGGGRLSKKEFPVFDVDHINGLPKFKTFDDIGEYIIDLMESPLQILCRECHKTKTKNAK